jgi:hypothetical protein
VIIWRAIVNSLRGLPNRLTMKRVPNNLSGPLFKLGILLTRLEKRNRPPPLQSA